jgi:serine/threonine protein kinase/Tol biopolymer transport system component
MKGTRLAGFEIIDKLGAGGMGEVWRARDEQLGRIVAIKVLPADLHADPDRRARFEIEARALAALNHPNIVSVYGAGEHEGRSYIVSELVEGESLRAVLDRGRVPFRKVVSMAVQIAEAMAAAHAAGIVHRDLKPENIMVTPDGRVKVLDFGLAKKTPVASPVGDATATLSPSIPGLVLGTAGYMSPEQVRGEAVDARSDIFSFGAVLYEVATGKRAFAGASAIETMHAVLHQDPPESSDSASSLSPALDTIIRRCLAKRPEQRFQSASDLAFGLNALSPAVTSATQAAIPARSATDKRVHRWILPVAAALGGVALFAAGFYLRDRTSHKDSVAYQRITFRTGLVTNARFAPGGRNVVYCAKWDGGPARIYLETPGTPDSRDLQLLDNALLLSVSAKDEIAFISPPFQIDGTGTLSRGSISGPVMRPALENVLGTEWSPDGSSMAVLRLVGGRASLEYPLGTVLWATSESPPLAFRVSPDGKRIAMAHYYKGTSIAISVIDPSKEKSKSIQVIAVVSDQTPNRIDPSIAWSPDGREIIFRSFDPSEWGTIYAMDMKGQRRILARAPGHLTLYDVASDGRMLIRTDNRQLGILGAAPGGSQEMDLSCLDASRLIGISADGQAIAAEVSGESGGPKGSVYLRKTDGSSPVRIGDGAAYALSPDGQWVSGYSAVGSNMRRYALLPAGAGEEHEINVPQLKGFGVVFGWRPDHETLLVFGPGKTRNYQNYAWNQTSGALKPIGPEGQGDVIPLVSPDTQRIITKGPDGNWWAYSVDGGESRRIQGLTTHDYPVGWRSDNRSIYIVTHHNENQMLPVSTLDIETGARAPWKEIRPMRPVEQVENLKITPDGKAYAYNFIVKTSDLYITSPVK